MLLLVLVLLALVELLVIVEVLVTCHNFFKGISW
jgi:hypothetical protein